MNGLSSTLFHSKQYDATMGIWVADTPVARLVDTLEHLADERGLTLSRWQSSTARWIVNITYALHYGERPTQSRYLDNSLTVAVVKLANQEGRTQRCEAYRKLSELLSVLSRLPVRPKQPEAIVGLRRTNPDKFADYWLIYGADFIASASDEPSHPHGVWGYSEGRYLGPWHKQPGLPVTWDHLPLTLQRFLAEIFSK